MIFNSCHENFEKEVIQASFKQAIVVDLWADWCPPCLSLAPILEKVIKEMDGKVLLAKVDVDEGENMKIAGRYQAKGFPTVLLIVDGEEKNRFYSTRSLSFIRDFLQPWL